MVVAAFRWFGIGAGGLCALLFCFGLVAVYVVLVRNTCCCLFVMFVTVRCALHQRVLASLGC